MAKPHKVLVRIREASGDQEETTMGFHLGSAIDTLASIETAAQSVVEALQAIITGEVYEVSVSLPLDITGWTLAPSDGTDTDKLVGARLVMSSNDPFYAKLNFPTFDLAKLTAPGEKSVDQVDADVAALLVALTGTTLTTNQDIEVGNIVSFTRTYGGKE